MSRRHTYAAVVLTSLCFGLAQLSVGQETSAANRGVSPALIEPEACALFVWVGPAQGLRLISAESGIFGFDSQNKRENYRLVSKAGADKFGQYTQQDYANAKGGTYQLHLGTPENKGDMVLYASGTLTLPSEDGWLQFENVKAVSTCNKSGAFSQIELADASAKFLAPNWVKSPDEILATVLTAPTTLKIAESLAPEPNPVVVEAAAPRAKPQLIRASYSAPLAPQIIEPQVTPTPTPAPSLIAEAAPGIEIFAPQTPQYSVQFGAFKDVSLALKHLDVSRDAAPYLTDLQPEIQESEVEGKGTFFRLRVTAFDDKSSAREFCSRLKDDGLDCFVP